MSESERRLAAIMYTDMVGYTALGQRNESLSLALVEEQRKLIRPILSRHNGREIKTMGDAFLVEFPNATDSIRCAYDIQRAVREFNLSLVTDKRIHLRVGVHLGEVTESQGDISGDAVNVASRIYPLAEDGGVCVTRTVYDFVRGKVDIPLSSIGAKTLKNVVEPMEVYKMEMPWEQQSATKEAVFLPRDRIAILPFANMSPDPNDEYFADGVTDEIITTASGISGLQVISRTSVMRYKKTDKGVKEIGRELEVGSVLEGSFKKAGNRIRVTAQLIDVAGDRHLWAQNYDRNLDDVFEVQSDIAKQVAEALRVRILSPEKVRIERKPTVSTAAYTLYLKGRYLWNRRGLDDLKKAAEYFELSVREDPDFALGYAGQADCFIMLRNDWGNDFDLNLEKARTLTARALKLDPNLAEALTTRGMVESDFTPKLAEEDYRKAIELKPSYATAHQWYMWTLIPQRRWDEAIEHIEKAVELDPLSPIINENHGSAYLWKGEYEKAVELLTRAAELEAEGAHFDLATAYGRMGRFDEMRREVSKTVELLQPSAPLARTYGDLTIAHFEKDKQVASRLLLGIEARVQDDPRLAFYLAECYFSMGENDKGFEWLRYADSRRIGYSFITVDPDLDAVRMDSRYLDLVKRLGLD